MTKLQKQVAYKYKDRPIYKYRINIPAEIIENFGWNREGVELDFQIKGKKLEITPKQ
jgi:hypothetical protein